MTKREIEEIINQLKSYIDSVLNGYGQSSLTFSSFEKDYMKYYSGKESLRQDTFRIFLRSLEDMFKESDDVMIEAFMDGIELANGCYKTHDKSVVFPITEVVSKNEFFDFNAKYKGEVTEITPARLSPELTQRVQQLTSAIYDILDCKGIVRVDYIITEGDKINMLEINTTPGMTATSFIPQQVRAAGLDIKDVMTDIIEDHFRQ